MTSRGSRNSRLSFFNAPELRAWQGRMAQQIVFLGYGGAMSTALAILHANASDAGQLAFQQVPILIPVASTIGILIAIWHRAPNTSPFWDTPARSLAAAPGLNRAFVLFFLQHERMSRHARG